MTYLRDSSKEFNNLAVFDTRNRTKELPKKIFTSQDIEAAQNCIAGRAQCDKEEFSKTPHQTFYELLRGAMCSVNVVADACSKKDATPNIIKPDDNS